MGILAQWGPRSGAGARPDAPDAESGWRNIAAIGITFFAALIGTLVLGPVLARLVGRRIPSAGAFAAWAVISAGTAIGALVFLPWWSVPQVIGTSWPGTKIETVWGAKEWLFYSVPVALPALGFVLAAAFAAAVARRRRGAQPAPSRPDPVRRS